MRLVHIVDRWLARLELSIALLAMTGLVALLIAQVFFRYILGAPLFFAEELALVLLVIATFTGLSLLVAEKKLVAVDAMQTIIGPRAHRWTAWLMRLIVFAVSATLVWTAYRYLSVPWVWIEQSPTLGLPTAWIYLAVAGELLALSFHQLVQVIDTWPGAARERAA